MKTIKLITFYFSIFASLRDLTRDVVINFMNGFISFIKLMIKIVFTFVKIVFDLIKTIIFAIATILWVVIPIVAILAVIAVIAYALIYSIIWLWPFIAEYYEIFFIILIGATIIYMIILALMKIGQKYWKTLFWIWLVLSIMRLIFLFWIDWEFFSNFSSYLLGILGLGILIIYLLSRNWGKVNLPRFDIRAFLFRIFIALGLIAAFVLILLTFFSLFNLLGKENSDGVVDKITTTIVEIEDSVVEPMADTFVFTKGSSIWGFLEEQGIEKDSLLSKSISVSKENTLKSFVINKDDEKVWVTKIKVDSLRIFYQRSGKKYVTIVSEGANACWYPNTKKLVIDE